MNLEDRLIFIARHYRKGLFAVEPALRKVKNLKKRFWNFPKIAVACAILVVIGATAAIIVNNSYHSSPVEESAVPVSTETVKPALISRVIDFDDVPLPVVVERINLVYGVEVTDLPDNAGDLYLSLHYEGNALELIDTINEILDTRMRIKE